jgi:hypothetical protein
MYNDSFETATMPSPHFFVFNCWSDWSEHIFKEKVFLKQLAIISVAARSIDYSESSQLKYFNSIDPNKIKRWTIKDDNTKQYITLDDDDTIFSLIDDLNLRGACMICNAYQNLTVRRYDINDYIKSMVLPTFYCKRDYCIEERKDDRENTCCNCCPIGIERTLREKNNK